MLRKLRKKILECTSAWEAALSSKWAAGAHKRLMHAQWRMGDNPEFFDHHIDLLYQWTTTRSAFWVERGVFGGIALKGRKVLELACGDGFNAKNFYSGRSEHVLACDFDQAAIATAKRKNSAPNVTFQLADIRTNMPQGVFENVVWDAAIEHFTVPEIADIMANIKRRLTPDGVLSGYTLVDGPGGIHQHEYEFKGLADLASFLTPYFKNVRVFETLYPDRHNLYFWASDAILPFDQDWPHGAVHRK